MLETAVGEEIRIGTVPRENGGKVMTQRLFSEERINQGRQLELDIAKGLAILFMVFVHCFESLTPIEVTATGYMIEFLGGPLAAPVFMFALGVGIVYSRKSTPADLAVRGIRLLILAYVLNFLRSSLPQMFQYFRTGDPGYAKEAVALLFGVDILPFAGLVFLFFAATYKLSFTSIHYLLSGLIMAGANLLLLNVVPKDTVLNVISGSFWGTNYYAWFPFLTWIMYPLAGYLFGELLMRCTNKKRLYMQTLQIAFSILGLLAIYFVLKDGDLRALNHLILEAYYHHTIVANLFMIAVTLAWLSTLYFWTAHIPSRIKATLARWSKNITPLYFVHGVILGWTLAFVEPTLTLPWMFVYSIALLAISDWISHSYGTIKSRMKTQRKLQLS